MHQHAWTGHQTGLAPGTHTQAACRQLLSVPRHFGSQACCCCCCCATHPVPWPHIHPVACWWLPQKPDELLSALCAARCRMNCVVSTNRLAQFSTQLVSLLLRYEPGELMHFSKQTSVNVAIIVCTCASCCSRSINACNCGDGPAFLSAMVV